MADVKGVGKLKLGVGKNPRREVWRKTSELGDQTDIFQTKDEGKWGGGWSLASGRDDGNIYLSLLAFFGSSMTSKIK